MSELPYLLRLGARLSDGIEKRSAAFRGKHRNFLLSKQRPDGGFAGREGESDLYYTGFAVRGLALLDAVDERGAATIGRFLRANASAPAGIVDLLSWLYSAVVVQFAGGPDLLSQVDASWSDDLGAWVEAFRASDGGYAKGLDGAAGSTYHTFLAALVYELIDRPPPDSAALVRFVLERRRNDGGFVEIDPMKRSGTNPTAAAAAVLHMFDATTPAVRQGVGEFLESVRGDEGGFQANTRIPFCDSLSTFTGLLTAADLDLTEVFDGDAVERFILSLESTTGGFHGAAWDQIADVEYTFYALGALALL